MTDKKWLDPKAKFYGTDPLRIKFKSPRDKKILNSLNQFKTSWEIQIGEIEDKLKNNIISIGEADKGIKERLDKIEGVTKQIINYKEKHNII